MTDSIGLPVNPSQLATYIVLSEPTSPVLADVEVGSEPNQHPSIDIPIGTTGQVTDTCWGYTVTLWVQS